MTVLWIAFGVMLLAGTLFVCWPMYRHKKRLSVPVALGAIGVLTLTAALYMMIGSPGVPSGAGDAPTIDDMVAELDARLAQNPDDIEGWKMLARSYAQLREYDRSVAAYEKALELEDNSNAQTIVDLAEVLLIKEGDRVTGRAADLFEAALAIRPDHSKALFYGGIAAIERNDPELAADRWEVLLAQSPPEEIRDILTDRISEWRGGAPTSPAAAATIKVRVTLTDAARSALPASATVFIIARDPAQPSPPVAVTRRKVHELPDTVMLSDADSMIPGRTLSQFGTLEVVVRASATGDPLPSSGDWFGGGQLTTSESRDIAILVDQAIP